MKLRDVERKMKVKASNEINCNGKLYITPGDIGIVEHYNKLDEYVLVKWENPILKHRGHLWHISHKNIEPLE